jgi:hypothetical protein
MRAGIHAVAGGDEQARINVLINRVNSSDRTSEFRHIIRKTHDSSQWVKNGLRILAELHYHETDQFVNELSALFSYDSSIAYALLKAGQCKLRFAEGSIEHAFDFDVRSPGNLLAQSPVQPRAAGQGAGAGVYAAVIKFS